LKNFTGFHYSMTTEIVFGKGTESQVADLIKKYGGTKVMMVYGQNSIKKTGLYDRVVEKLKGAGIDFVELPGVRANPRRSLAQKGYEQALEQGVDFLLGVGGGSAIDTAKAVAIALANGGDYWKYYCGVPVPQMFPVGTIHTLSAAGSETSGSSVLVDDIDGTGKHGMMVDTVRPKFAIMNPELTYTVSAFQTGSGSADIFAHTVMRYFSNSDSHLGDEYCEGTLRTVVKYAKKAVDVPDDYEARAELMLAGSFSHNDLTSIGRSGARGGEHGLERQLSGYYDTAHGAGLAVCMPPMLEYFAEFGDADQVARVARFGVRVFGSELDVKDMKATALDGIERFRAWLRSIGMPLTLKELGIPKEDLADVIRRCAEDGEIHGFMDLDVKAMTWIFSRVVE